MPDASTTPIGGGRPRRPCDLCGAVDDHPRHVLATGAGDPLADPHPGIIVMVAATVIEDPDRDAVMGVLLDRTTAVRHLDCCRAAGCPDGSCATQTAGAETARGADLLAHLTGA